MSKLTDMQLVILSAASQGDDRGVELPANVNGEGARKVVDKLIRAGLLEEVRASGSLPVWRRNDVSGPMALCITKSGLKATGLEDEATAAPKETSVLRDVPTREGAPKTSASRKQISIAAQKSARKKHHAADRNWFATRKPAGLETNSGACDAAPTRGSEDCCYHARDQLAAALGPRLLRRCGAQKVRPRSQLGEGRR
jgi:hypothetical protein